MKWSTLQPTFDEMLDDSVRYAPDVPSVLVPGRFAVVTGVRDVVKATTYEMEGEDESARAALDWAKSYALMVYRKFLATDNGMLLINVGGDELWYVTYTLGYCVPMIPCQRCDDGSVKCVFDGTGNVNTKTAAEVIATFYKRVCEGGAHVLLSIHDAQPCQHGMGTQGTLVMTTPAKDDIPLVEVPPRPQPQPRNKKGRRSIA